MGTNIYIKGFRARQHLRSLAFVGSVMNDEWWPNYIQGPWGPKASQHLSYRWGETPEKTSPRKPVPTGDQTRARCVTGAHAAAWPTAVDNVIIVYYCYYCYYYYYYYYYYVNIKRFWSMGKSRLFKGIRWKGLTLLLFKCGLSLQTLRRILNLCGRKRGYKLTRTALSQNENL